MRLSLTLLELVDTLDKLRMYEPLMTPEEKNILNYYLKSDEYLKFKMYLTRTIASIEYTRQKSQRIVMQ